MRRLEGAPGVEVRLLKSFAQLPVYIREFAHEGVTDLFISGGDGTIHAVQTMLAEERPFPNQPRLCLLPHGTTNMTAADIGFRRKGIGAQADFIRSPNGAAVEKRPTVRAVNPKDGKPRHGMFLGAGAATDAGRYCQNAWNARGIKGGLANLATLLAAIFKGSKEGEPPINRPHDMGIDIEGREVASGPHLLMLVTTLDKLVLGAHPFWGPKTDPLRVTLVSYPQTNIALRLLPALYGSERRQPPSGLRSFSCASCEIRTSSEFIMDGEFFDAKEGEPLRVETGPALAYIRG
jgi:diacylglycerol kinase family enzyme